MVRSFVGVAPHAACVVMQVNRWTEIVPMNEYGSVHLQKLGTNFGAPLHHLIMVAVDELVLSVQTAHDVQGFVHSHVLPEHVTEMVRQVALADLGVVRLDEELPHLK